MFGNKQLPPHCEDLQPAQVRLVRKIINCEYNYKARAYAQTALDKNWGGVFVAIAKNPRYPYSEYKQTFFERMLQSGDPALALAVLPHLNGLKESHHASLIAMAMRADGLVVRQGILSMPIAPNLRAAAALCLIWGEESEQKGVTPWLFKLLEAPTNLHYDGGLLLKRALHAERFDVADALVRLGFDLAVYADDIKAYLVEQKSPHAARLWLDKHAQAPAAAVPAPQVLVQDGQGYLRSGDCASRVDQLPDGGSLTTVFNFATCQQILIAHVAGQTAAPAVTPFSQIEGSVALSDAAAAFVRQGGAPERVYGVTMTAARPALLEKPARLIGKAPSSDSP